MNELDNLEAMQKAMKKGTQNLGQQVETLKERCEKLKSEVGMLSYDLKAPGARPSWGDIRDEVYDLFKDLENLFSSKKTAVQGGEKKVMVAINSSMWGNSNTQDDF